MSTPTGRDVVSEVAFLARELKTPVINETFAVLGDRARAEGWSPRTANVSLITGVLSSRARNATSLTRSLPAGVLIERPQGLPAPPWRRGQPLRSFDEHPNR